MKYWVIILILMIHEMWEAMGPFGLVLSAPFIGYTVAYWLTRREKK